MAEEWFSLDDIEISETDDTLYCISVDSEDKQFLIGEMGVPTHNTEEGKAESLLKGEAQQIISSIARLGRAAGVHLILATQRPDATLIPGETKANLGVRINCGHTDSSASSMILGSGEGMRVKANPRGRLYLSIYGRGDHGQGFFAQQSWIDEWLAGKGLNPDGTPLSQPTSKLANLVDMSTFEDGDLDTREGVDKGAIIEQIRAEEAESISGGDGEFHFEEDEDPTANLSTEPTPENSLGRPDIMGKKSDPDQYSRPEDSWDQDLEDLIEENF